ncbi:hypothetical protein NC652_004734 [Populus alba x Populus x berolinensis]|nr:hypothetical protein NC652_004734 [Populus alba x Populus x berolinensis]
MMANNRERMNTLVAAGAAAGISSGFNAPVAGCFFAIETVLRPLHAENSPPFTTAMILLASVISSTVSNTLLGTQSAFTVPSYDLKSAAVWPSLAWSLGSPKHLSLSKEKFGLHPVACPALGGLGAGIIALKYPGILYWGFTNVEEILHTGKSASAPGIWLLTQLAAAKVVATALCKGSLLVGGLYAPSLMIGAAVGAVFGGSAAELINSAIPGNAAVAQPQAYALVGMAATLASVCSVPLTSILLLFELTKDYRIILPLMGAVGLAIWVPSVADHGKENERPGAHSLARGYSSLSNDTDDEAINEDLLAENLKVSKAMSKNYAKVALSLTLKEAIKYMHDSKQNCLLVVDDEDLLEGILTYGDIRRLSKTSSDASTGDSTIIDVNTCLVSTVCTREIRYRGQVRGLLTCYPDTDLAIAKDLMEAKGIKQLPVVKRSRGSQKDWKRRVVAILHYDSIWNCLRHVVVGLSFFSTYDNDPVFGTNECSSSCNCTLEEIARRGQVHQNRKEDDDDDDDGMLMWDLQTLITTPLDLLLLVLDIYTVQSVIAKHKKGFISISLGYILSEAGTCMLGIEVLEMDTGSGAMGVGVGASRISPDTSARGHGFYNSEHRSFNNRGFGRGQGHSRSFSPTSSATNTER